MNQPFHTTVKNPTTNRTSARWTLNDEHRDGIVKMMDYFYQPHLVDVRFNINVGELIGNGNEMGYAELSGYAIYHQLKEYLNWEFYSDNSRDILNGIRECYLQHRVKG
jgi:hypothetical protein